MILIMIVKNRKYDWNAWLMRNKNWSWFHI